MVSPQRAPDEQIEELQESLHGTCDFCRKPTFHGWAQYDPPWIG